MSPSPDGPVRDFHASWRSSAGVATLLLTAFALAGAVVGLTAPGGTRIVGWLCAALFGAIAALGFRPFAGTKPVLRVGPRGIKSLYTKGRTIPWADIRDVAIEAPSGHTQVVVTLAPGAASLATTKPRLGGRKPVRRIPLAALARADVPLAIAEVQQAFVRHATGAAADAAQAHVHEAEAAAEFQRRLLEATPRTWALYAMVALNVGIWIANVAKGMNAVQPLASDLFAWGANSAWAVTRDHELWRLLTATFLHGGLMHLALNMLGLWGAGLVLNRLHGNLQFLLIYFGSALVGSALSLRFSSQLAVGVGASGAVFGVLGALLVSVYKHRRTIPVSLGKNLLASQGVFIAYSLAQGFARQGIDNAAHVGGLLAGAVLAALLVEKIDAGRGGARARASAGMVLAAAVVAALVVTTPQPPIDHRRSFEVERVSAHEWPRLQASQVALVADAKAHTEGKLAEAQFVEAIEKRHLPTLRDVNAKMAALSLPATDPREAVLRDLKLLPALMVEGLEVELLAHRGHVPVEEASRKQAELGRRMAELTARQKARSASSPKPKR